MQTNLSDVEYRIRRYWYTDGIGELIGGGILQVSLILLMIAGARVSRKLVNALKTRLTYPRTGYVQYRVNKNDARWRRTWVAGLAVGISGLTMVFVRLFHSFDSMVAVTGVAVGLILVIRRAKSSGRARFYILGAGSLVFGLALSVSGLPDAYSPGMFYSLMGLCFIPSGGWTLRRYLEENSLPVDPGHQNG